MNRTVMILGATVVSLTVACVAAARELPTVETATSAWYDGDREEAIAQFERLLAAAPENDDIRADLLVLLREAGDLERAIEITKHMGPGRSSELLMTTVLAGVASPPAAKDRDGDRGSDPRRLLWEAAGRYLDGEANRAEELLLSVADGTAHLPYAYLLLGLIARERRDWEQSVAWLTIARRQEPNLTAAFVPLAEARFALGEREDALALLRRAEIALPWNGAIPELRARWERRLPELVARQTEETERRRTIAEPPTVEVVLEDRETIPRLRVGLAESLSSVYLKTGGDFRIVKTPSDLVFRSSEARLAALRSALDGESAATGAGGAILRVIAEGSGVVVEDESGSRIVAGDRPLRLVYDDPGRTTIVFDLAFGEGQFSAGREDRSYRGHIEVLPRGGTFTLVNDLNVEEYLYSVVPSEMPSYWPTEALEAQAIAARSYTLHRRTRFHGRGFDLVSSVASAFYRGVTGEHPRTTGAVRSTRGVVLAEGAGTLDAVYSANSAGYTESSESVWGHRTSLVAVSAPLLPPLETPRRPSELYDWIVSRPGSHSGDREYAAASAYRWRLLVPRQTIERRLSSAGYDVGTVRVVSPGRRGITGRVEWVRIEGSRGEAVVRRDIIRSRLGGLRSNLFTVSPLLGEDRTAAYFLFEGAGWGHGVGMDQTGAAGMAGTGRSAEEILAHYYPLNALRVDY